MWKACRTLAMALMISVLGLPGAARPPLETNQRVQNEFLAGAVGDEIRKNCPSISARLLRVAKRIRELESYALSLGYSRSDIEKMRKSPSAKAKLKSMRDAYLSKNGVVAGNSASYCSLGRAEIKKKSLTGWLLREK